MDNMIYLFAVVVLFAAILASIAIWTPRKLWIRGASVVATAGLIIVAYVGFSDLLSRPKPIHLEWAMRGVSEARVLGASFKENEAIFVWLEIDGVDEPRAYKLPWSRELAEQLQEAMEEDRGNRTGVRVRAPFKAGQEDEDQQTAFYSPPRSPPAVKTARGSDPLVFGDTR